jgi:aminoglycoside phosphotransferase (APT) family kinase protein
VVCDCVGTLYAGDPFRDWLVHDVIGDRIQNSRCPVKVYKHNSSHTVCQYQFDNENISVIAKFFSEPTHISKLSGRLHNYNPYKSMVKEYNNLEMAGTVIDVAKPLAVNNKFNCVLVTEYIQGKPLSWYVKHEEKLYKRLSSVAHMLRKLHDNTKSSYDKENEFRNFHDVLDTLKLDYHIREKFNILLGKWWYSTWLNRDRGCMVHRDVHPANYIFDHRKPYAIDFESSWFHAHPIRDLGILTSEIKNSFAWHHKDDIGAEPYIGNFLWEYSKDKEDFYYNTKVLPFFISIGLLRSARIHQGDHKKYLIKEAIECLKAIEKED